MGACGDLLLDLICGELINVAVSHSLVFLQICKSALELCMTAMGLHVVTPLGIMCFSHNLRQLMLLVFLFFMP